MNIMRGGCILAMVVCLAAGAFGCGFLEAMVVGLFLLLMVNLIPKRVTFIDKVMAGVKASLAEAQKNPEFKEHWDTLKVQLKELVDAVRDAKDKTP